MAALLVNGAAKLKRKMEMGTKTIKKKLVLVVDARENKQHK